MHMRGFFNVSHSRQLRLHDASTFIIVEPGLIPRDRNARRAAELAVVEAERPVMPRTDRAAVLHVAGRKVAAGVGAMAVDHGYLPAGQENREVISVDFDVFALVLDQLFKFAK
jgi:hypothetical protein